MDIDLIFKIAAIGIIVAVLNLLLKRAERDEQAMMTTLAGLIVVLLMIVRQIGNLFETIKEVFGIMVRNQMAATPQKKNIRPFCSRPVSLTPKTLAIMKPIVTINATATLDNGICQPKARQSVLK